MKLLKYIGAGLIIILAFIGLVSIAGFIAIEFHFTNVKGVVDAKSRYLQAPTQKTAWKESEEWQTLQKAILNDKSTIQKVASETGITSRLIVAQLVVEQMRLYSSQREIYKEIFKPLQILGVQSQYSWGVMGLKQETAIQIENNLKDSTSPFYLGKTYENKLDFSTNDPDTERFNRIVDEHNHYYSYLYTALYIKQIETQWEKAGFPISNRPEIISTLYNIGFSHSNPNGDPKVGGAEIIIGTETYSFGELAYAFYTSDQLLTDFPRK